jgi:hypothetical protein
MIEPISVQHGRHVHAMLDLEFAIPFLGVEFPDLLSVAIEASEIARAAENKNVFAVGTGRWRGLVGLIATEPCFAFAELLLPQLLALGADAQEHQVVPVLAGQEQPVAPDRRGGPAHARQRQLPDDVPGRTPFGRNVGFRTNAVIIWTAPLRPVFTTCRSNPRHEPT